MGDGCTIMVLWVLAGVELVLALAARFAIRWLVGVIFFFTAGLTAMLLPPLVLELWRDHRKRVAAKGVRISPGELESRLIGRTHVSPEFQNERGTVYRQVYRYEPGGRLTISEEEAGGEGAARRAG